VNQNDSLGGRKANSAQSDPKTDQGQWILTLPAGAAGKNLRDFVSVPGSCGETTLLLHAFNDAVAYLGDEYFDPDGLALAQRAMAALNVQCFSTRKGPVVKAILDACTVRQPICRRTARREA
jgi:hypothetical protein